MEFIYFSLAFIAAVVAGFVNAIAGGGTLLTFPVLLAIGVPPISANITNTTALVPGLIGGMWAQRKEFITQKRRIILLLPVTIAGGLMGGYLLLNTSEKSFSLLIPYLILTATLLLILQPTLKKWLNKQLPHKTDNHFKNIIIAVLILISALYGGYFGAGLGVILMAILGLSFNNSLTTINVLKQALSFVINISATIYFLFSSKIIWSLALIMIIGSISGGYIGGKLVTKMNSDLLRWIIIAVGLSVGIYYLIR